MDLEPEDPVGDGVGLIACGFVPDAVPVLMPELSLLFCPVVSWNGKGERELVNCPQKCVANSFQALGAVLPPIKIPFCHKIFGFMSLARSLFARSYKSTSTINGKV